MQAADVERLTAILATIDSLRACKFEIAGEGGTAKITCAGAPVASFPASSEVAVAMVDALNGAFAQASAAAVEALKSEAAKLIASL